LGFLARFLLSQKATNSTNFFSPYIWHSSHQQTDRKKTHGFPATALQKQNAWLSSHNPAETKNMAFQPPPYTETKHMAFQPPTCRNKIHGIPATSKQTETKHMAFQPLFPETQAFSFQKRYG